MLKLREPRPAGNLLLALSQQHARLFMERYDWLLRRAMELAEDAEQAQDILHDAFVQFTVRQPNLDDIENLDAYLRTMLRNIHVSLIRRRISSPIKPLAIAEYDSAELGLFAMDASAHLQAQDELHRICEYACMRKEKSKSGSVLILRFFHGYYPGEIAKILRSSRQAVDDQLLRGRNEVRLHLANRSRDPEDRDSRKAVRPDAHATVGRYLGQICRTIFAARQGECLPPETLCELYRKKTSPPVSCELLAHFVSCPDCLDEVNRILGLPPLRERFPTDTIGPDTRPKGGPGGGMGGSQGPGVAVERTFSRRAKDVYEHRPQELFISVNGYFVGSQKISSPVMEQALSVNIPEAIGFVEIFSDQGIRLLMFEIAPVPGGNARQSESVGLSDGRTLKAALSFGVPWPTLQVRYHDPGLRPQPDRDREQEAFLQSENTESIVRVNPREASIWRILPLRWARRCDRLFAQRHSSIRRGILTAGVAILLAVVLMIAQIDLKPVTAAALLTKSRAADGGLRAPGHVLHGKFTLEERRHGSAVKITRRRIEIWQQGLHEAAARRVYDENGRLVGGLWLRPDGAEIVHERDKDLQRGMPVFPVDFGMMWRQELSAEAFTRLVGSSKPLTVEIQPKRYILDYKRSLGEGDGLLEAELQLERVHFHAVEETFVAKERGELHDFRLAEESLELLPLSTVSSKVFEPDAELLPPAPKKESVPHPAFVPKPVAASPELQVAVLGRLDQVNAFSGEQVSTVRAPDGQLVVKGMVDTTQRKVEILSALGPLIRNPAVRIDVSTVAELQARQRPTASQHITTQDVEITQRAVPVAADLRLYFSTKSDLSDQALEEETRRFSQQVFLRSVAARLDALALKQIVESFTPAELQAMDPAAKAEWRSMVNKHAQAFWHESEMLRQALEPIFPQAVPVNTDVDGTIVSQGGLRAAANRLFDFASANDEAIRRSFSISSDLASADQEPRLPIKGLAFWKSLRSAESLAAEIVSSQ